MRVLIVSDIHGNLEALQAVLSAAGSSDAATCLGDIVGYGPSPNECVETVSTLPGLVCLAGNHDLGAADRIDTSVFSSGALLALLWTRRVMRPECMEYLMRLQPTGAAHGLALAHASPRDPVWEYLEWPQQAAASFELFSESACLVGHTHVPRLFGQGTGRTTSRVGVDLIRDGDVIPVGDGVRRILNPGSVGQPRDGDPRAAYALLDTDAGVCAFHRVEYPLKITQRKILEAGLPPSLASRLSVGM